MTWIKKQNTRAYEPIAAVSVTPLAGSITGLTVSEAYYTVVNDYLCMFNLFVAFTQAGAGTTGYVITSPLGILTVANSGVGNGSLYNGSSQLNVWAERLSATTFTVALTNGATVTAGQTCQLRVLGHFAVR